MPSTQPWTEAQIPNMQGKVAIVTGANSGIGYETARALAQKGAKVIMACRSVTKANEAAAHIREQKPSGSIQVMALDLNDLSSVRQFVAEFKEQNGRLDLLINNAGIMNVPYGKTAQGFESQLGVNHFGHFALTGLLLDLLRQTEGSRVVTVSSMMHRQGQIDFDNLQWTKNYNPMSAYSRSKLANLLFTYELQRKLDFANVKVMALAAHPGWTATNLQDESAIARMFNPLLAQQPPMGALPTLYAATGKDVKGGEYCGPSGFWELGGYPKVVPSNAASHDERVAQQLWEVSEKLTGVTYHFS